MSKLMSFIEKLKPNQHFASSDKDYFYAKGEAEANNIEEDMEKDMDKDIEEIILVKNEKESLSAEKQMKEKEVEVQTHIKKYSKYSIPEIYESYNVEVSDFNTVFMLGNFMNALPESLPSDVRKKSLISIVASSNIRMEDLMGDGEKRLDILKQFTNNYHDLINSDIAAYNKKIAELKNQIKSFEDEIKINENLLKEQNNVIKYETDKIENIFQFLSQGE